ncbi:uncharacterized protein N7459_002744 [Penicillium hispanicum]|uniref:uncharacterized protein n=1 Tax=Penicillium hispanicum TaxID=1080232 RepID=UPI0025401FF4|nr:uncharacterized protein N7459_002744 [Penicillium hispanicum]KAJ5586979.1 hypothetical protein N7459_002744 [Penicillium hispanicum]
MTDSVRPGLQPVSLLKAGPTTSSSRSTALPSPTHPPFARPSSRLRTRQSGIRDEPLDATSEKATVVLIRRVLCPQTSSQGASSLQPPEELLPPLTSSNEVDRQLYAILAILIKEFVYSWYSKITPDQTLVNEVLQVVAHCTRALEQRIRQIDVAQLVLDDIPALVEAHILSYRLAKQRSQLSGLPTSHRALYHELNPHPGLSPVPDATDPDTITAQAENESDYRRLLANGTLAVLLPTEDLENNSLRTLVGDVLADLILGKEVAGRICEAQFFYEVTTKLTTMVRHGKSAEDPDTTTGIATNRLERFGLLSTDDEPAKSEPAAQSQATVWIWNILQSIYVGYVALRFIATGLFRVASSPGSGSSHGASVSFPAATPGPQKREGIESSSSDGVAGKRPVLGYRVYSMASQLLGVSERMPWLSGLFALVQHLVLAGPGRLGDTDGIIDRFLRDTIEEYVLAPTLLPNLLLATRTALFPASARPASLTTAVNTGSASGPTPQLSVQPPTPSGKALSTASITPAAAATIAPTHPAQPILEGARAPGSVSETLAKSNAGSSNHINITGSGGDHLPGSAAVSSTVDDAVNVPLTSPPTRSEKRTAPSSQDIAAIKRRCAASLLAVIPRKVAQTFFGVPAPSSGDRTCSTTTGSSSSLTTISPPASIEEGGGDAPRSSPPQGTEPSPVPLASSAFATPGGRDERPAAERVRTDGADDEPVVDPEDLFLLRTIETDLLDLFADAYCNKHLVYAIIETVLAKVLPELSERSVTDLMEVRGVATGPGSF